MSLVSINPATGETIQNYKEMDERQVAVCIENAHSAFSDWRRSSFETRSALLVRTAQTLDENQEKFARLMAMEMGKPITDGRKEIEKCAWVCRHYAKNGPKMLTDEIVDTGTDKSYITFQPLGVVLAVMPWNYPFWQVFRFAAPALMAGNVALLKHASNVSGCALAIEKVFETSAPGNALFQTLLVSSRHVETIIDHPLVRGVSLTGSSKAGKAVAAAAGKHMKPGVYELGGSDPYVVLADAPLAQTLEACVASRLLNSGQSCIAAKRFIVHRSLLQPFSSGLVEAFQGKKMGNPLDESVEIGPQARMDLRENLHRQVKESVEMGAHCLLGGRIPEHSGAFYPPTVLTGVTRDMPVFREETFGPVAAVIEVSDEEEAIEVANETPFGLGAAVFTADVTRGERIARTRLQAGSCFVNAFVRSDPRLPFGGIKGSGTGRELSHYGLKAFVNVKTIVVSR